MVSLHIRRSWLAYIRSRQDFPQIEQGTVEGSHERCVQPLAGNQTIRAGDVRRPVIARDGDWSP